MKKANSPEFKLLEAIKKQRLKNQEDSPYASRMYLDFPRFRINTNLEYGQSGELTKDIKDKTVDLILVDLPYGQTAFEWDIKIL